jgi:hypothetical protein
MANQSISQLPVASAPLTGDELSVIVQNGVTKQTSLQNVANLGGPTGPVGPVGPTGPTGPAATVQVQSTTTTAPGTNANVINIGSTTAAYLEFYIPRGDVGATGATGATGPVGPGVAAGGTTGQVLTKASSVDYATTWVDVAGTGTVTSVNVAGGTTGLTFSGGPVTIAGTITMGGTLGVANGGTGAVSLTGYLKGNGTSAFTGSATIPTTDLSGTISNAQLANSAITINGTPVSLGGSTTITPSSIGAISAVNGTTNQITTSQVGTVATVALADNTVMKGVISVLGTNVTSFTPFTPALQAWQVDDNNYREVYVRNVNNGSDASSDFVAYNDASDVNSYFIDMGMNSSNFTSVSYPIFTPNSGYLFTGGGSTGQESDLFIGTSNTSSDIIFFAGGVETTNKAATLHGATGNLVLGTNADTGYQLNVTDSAYIQGVMLFGDAVTLHQDPTSAMQAATKQYVDSAVSTGFTVHPSVVYATTAALAANTYNNGTLGVGATLTGNANGALIIDGHTFVSPTDVGVRVLIKNEATTANNGCYTVTQVGSLITPYILTRATDFDQAAVGEIANNAYFFVTAGSANIGTSYILSQTAAITVGTTALPFTLFASSLTYTGGTNIDVTGQTISLTGTVAATNGGTGTNTVTTGDLLYGSATDTWSKLAVGSAYKSLVVNAAGTQVEWNAVALNQTTAVSGQLNVSNGGTGASTLTGYVKGNGTSAFTAASTVPTTDLSGTVTNAQLANSSITINGNSVSLGGSTTVTATATNALTIGTGLTGTSYNGSSAVTVAIDSTVATLTGSQTLTNKTMSGANNTFSNIPNTAITGLGTMSTQDANNVNITGGTVSVSTVTATTGIFGGTF